MAAQTQKENDEWNKAAMAAAKGGGLGSYVIPAAGAYGLYDVWKNKGGTTGGALQGAASGAAIGSLGGPLGVGLGALLGGVGSLFGGKSKTKIEEDRRDALAKQGINVPQVKGWESNAAFADSRNEADLRGSDIADASTLYGLFGSRWQNLDPMVKSQIADEALKKGLVREHHGTIDINATPDFMDYAQRTLGELNQKPKASAAKSKSKPKPVQRGGGFKADPGLSLADIMPIGRIPAPQAEPDNDFIANFTNYLQNRGR